MLLRNRVAVLWLVVPALLAFLAAGVFQGCGGRIAPLDGQSTSDAGPDATADEAGDDAPVDDGQARDGGRDGDAADDADDDADPDAPPPILPGDYNRPCLGPDPADADPGAPSATYPAFKPTTPRSVSGGGTVLTDATIVPITFSDDPFAASVQDFTARLGASSYWASFATNYGLHPPTVKPVTLPDPAVRVTTDGLIQDWLLDKLDGTHPEFPPPSPSSVYVLFYPATTRIIGGGMVSCRAPPVFHPPQPFTDYYAVTTVPNKPQVVYVVVPRCNGVNDLYDVDATTMAASHSLVGAITNPYGDGYGNVDKDHFLYGFLNGTTASDLCGVFPNRPPHLGLPARAADFDFLVQRQWSNVTALAGQDPCKPTLPTDVYFNASPVLTDTIEVALGDLGPFYDTKGMHIPLGRCGIIELDVFSDQKTDTPIELNAYELRSYGLYNEKLSLQFAFSKTQARNGEKVYLEVGVMRHLKQQWSMFTLQSTVNGKSNYWPIAIDYAGH